MGQHHRHDSSAAGPDALKHIVPHFPVLVREQLSQLLALAVVETVDISHLIGCPGGDGDIQSGRIRPIIALARDSTGEAGKLIHIPEHLLQQRLFPSVMVTTSCSLVGSEAVFTA